MTLQLRQSMAAWLTLLYSVILTAPVGVGVMALACCEDFRRESFGLFRRSARGIQATLALLMAYHLAILAWAYQSGMLRVLVDDPFSPSANLLVAQAVLCSAALGSLAFASRSLCRILEPKSLPKSVQDESVSP